MNVHTGQFCWERFLNSGAGATEEMVATPSRLLLFSLQFASRNSSAKVNTTLLTWREWRRLLAGQEVQVAERRVLQARR